MKLVTLNSVGYDKTNQATFNFATLDAIEYALNSDRSKVIFLKEYSTNLYDVCIQNIDGTGFLNLTSGVGQNKHISFFNTQNKVLFTSNRVGGTNHLFSINYDGTGLTQLTSGTNEESGHINNDDTKLIYRRLVSGVYSLLRSDSNGANEVTLYSNVSFSVNDTIFSRDSTKIAFVNLSLSNHFHICIINLDGTGFLQLTNDAVFVFNQYPMFNHNDTKILFRSNLEGYYTVDSINLDGTNRTCLTQSDKIDEYIDVSTNNMVTFSRRKPEAYNGYNIFLTDKDFTYRKQLTFSNDRNIYNVSPVFSEDLTHILYEREFIDINKKEIRKINLTTYVDSLLVTYGTIPQGTIARAYSPRTSRDGQTVFFGNINNSGVDDVWKINIDGTNITRLTNSNDRFILNNAGIITNANDTKFCYTSYSDRVIVAPFTNVSPVTVFQANNYVESMSWHPTDANLLLFVANHTGVENVYTYNIGTSTLTQLTSGLGNNFNAVFSTDGTKIIYINENSTRDLWSMDLDGSNKTQLTFIDQHIRNYATRLNLTQVPLWCDSIIDILEEASSLFNCYITSNSCVIKEFSKKRTKDAVSFLASPVEDALILNRQYTRKATVRVDYNFDNKVVLENNTTYNARIPLVKNNQIWR